MEKVAVICRLFNLKLIPSQNSIYLVLPIVFSFRAKSIIILFGDICRWKGICVSHYWRFHDHRHMTHLRMHQNLIFGYFYISKMLSSAWAGARGLGLCSTFQYHSWTGSIKPSLQHFHTCCVGWPVRHLIDWYFWLKNAKIKKNKNIMHKTLTWH